MLQLSATMAVQKHSCWAHMTRKETIAGVSCLHIEAGEDIAQAVAFWRGAHVALNGRMGADGVCITVAETLGVDGVRRVFSALGGLPAASVVLSHEDGLHGRQMAMASAELGEVRAVFSDLLSAVMWIAARAKALQLARSLPRLEPELQVHKRAPLQTGLQLRRAV